jgi:hypothetical protein
LSFKVANALLKLDYERLESRDLRVALCEVGFKRALALGFSTEESGCDVQHAQSACTNSVPNQLPKVVDVVTGAPGID